jgi:hypothetical protein
MVALNDYQMSSKAVKRYAEVIQGAQLERVIPFGQARFIDFQCVIMILIRIPGFLVQGHCPVYAASDSICLQSVVTFGEVSF